MFVPAPTPVTAPFWEGTSRGLLRMQRCVACEKPFFYPRSFCPRCGGRDVPWVTLSGRGTIASALVLRRAVPTVLDDVPRALALVEVDEGPRLMAHVRGVALDDVWALLGLPVHAAFVDSDGVAVPVFEPVA